MTSAGVYGWVSDRSGYRYETRHPEGMAWPAIPDRVLGIWRAVSGVERAPQCCLVNFYDAGARRWGCIRIGTRPTSPCPWVSISLGDDALFRIGGTERGGATKIGLARLGRRGGAVGRGAACVSRHRPHPPGQFHASAQGWADQPGRFAWWTDRRFSGARPSWPKRACGVKKKKLAHSMPIMISAKVA